MGLGEVFALLSALCWGLGVVLYKRIGERLSASQLNLVKNSLVAVLMLPTVLVFEGVALPSLSAHAFGLSLISGVLGIALGDLLYLRALNMLGAGRMGVVGNLYSPFVIVLSFLFLGERLSALQLGGFVLVSMGVFLAGHARAAQATLPRKALIQAMLMGVSSVLLMALAIVMVKRVLETESFFWISFVRILGGLGGMLLLYLWRGELREAVAGFGQHLRSPLLLFAAFLGQYLSMMLWLAGYKYTQASVASVLNESTSIFILFFAWLILGERMNTRKLMGVLLTMAGIALMVV